MSPDLSLIATALGTALGAFGAIFSLAQVWRTNRAERELERKLSSALVDSYREGSNALLFSAAVLGTAVAGLPVSLRREIEAGIYQKSPEASSAFLRKLLANAAWKFATSVERDTPKQLKLVGESRAAWLMSLQSDFVSAEATVEPLERSRLFLAISEKIDAEINESKKQNSEVSRTAFLYLRLEQIRALIASQDEDAMRTAVDLCTQLETEYQHPLVYYRHGQLLALLREPEEAVRKLELSASLFESHADAQLFEAAQWFQGALPRTLGHAYWVLSNTQTETGRERPDRARLLKAAYDSTLKSLEFPAGSPRQEAMTLNNLIYYAQEFHSNFLQQDKSEWALKAIREHLPKLEELLTEDGVPSLNMLDTVCHAYAALGDRAKEQEYARRVVRLIDERDKLAAALGSKNAPALSKDEKKIRVYAENRASP